MRIKNYIIKLLFSLGAFLLIISTDLLAQRGRVHGYRHGYGYGRGYGYGYYHGPRVYSYARPYFSVGFRGVVGYGGYYRHYRPYYRAITYPVGFYLSILPRGFHRIYVNSYPYYYYGGTYYIPYGNGYKVTNPPLGALVDDLPPQAQAVNIDGQNYYVWEGTYYQEEIVGDNEVEYRVVGVHGVLDPEQRNSPAADDSYTPGIGERFSKLPAGCRSVTISGKKYYESPEGIYYEEIISPNKVEYEVVGKPGQ